MHRKTQIYPVQKGVVWVRRLPLIDVPLPPVRLTLVATHVIARIEAIRRTVLHEYWEEPVTGKGDHQRTVEMK